MAEDKAKDKKPVEDKPKAEETAKATETSTTQVEESAKVSLDESETAKANVVEDKPKAEEANGDTVIAIVPKRYSLIDDNHVKHTYGDGDKAVNVPMPRSHAEHWYSKAQGVKIIGVPDNGTIDGVGAQNRLKDLISFANSLAGDIKLFHDGYEGLTDGQRGDLLDAANLSKEIADLLEGL